LIGLSRNLVAGLPQLDRALADLLLEHVAELLLPREQSGILDRDDGLIGKGANDASMLRRVETRLRPVHAQPADAVLSDHQGRAAPRADLLGPLLFDP